MLNCPPASPAALSNGANVVSSRASVAHRAAAGLLLIAAAAIPVSLLWDFSWESTVGIDLIWALPHAVTYFAVALAGLTALMLMIKSTRAAGSRAEAVRLGPFHAPLGAWVSAWGACAFLVALLFDRWWQSAYGLSAGIWHPPQILKAISFFSILIGAWLFCLSRQNQFQSSGEQGCRDAILFVACGGLVLAMIMVVTLTSIYANRQHSAAFYNIACATYPIVLMAIAKAGELRWPATIAAGVCTATLCLMVWLLPLFPATPLVPPVYNRLTHLMAPPFPLLLMAPAMALDAWLRKNPSTGFRSGPWLQAVSAGVIFFVTFFVAQWNFAEFLLTDLADNWFFAGGGRHWPFFLKIDSLSRMSFWTTPQDEMNLLNFLTATGWAVLAARLGLWIGEWMKGVRR